MQYNVYLLKYTEISESNGSSKSQLEIMVCHYYIRLYGIQNTKWRCHIVRSHFPGNRIQVCVFAGLDNILCKNRSKQYFLDLLVDTPTNKTGSNLV
jgi:hypothetical protein